MVRETYFSHLALDTLADKDLRQKSRKTQLIAQHIIPTILDLEPEEQKAFLYSLIHTMADEGFWEITSRSEFALDILNDRAMLPILFTHAEDISRVYIEAVELQTPKKDPYSGSIFFLLEAGKRIAPFVPNSTIRGQLLGTWREIINKFPTGKKRTDIIFEVNNIENMMSPNPELDYHVRELRESGLTVKQIARELNVPTSKIIDSLARLIALGFIERKKSGRPDKTS